ncbi:MAG: hypothetical protein FJ139_02340 [Deltaproteobacteria bacterium]|nr:hypothetical protein [Deltaproteobacteria bacterium]
MQYADHMKGFWRISLLIMVFFFAVPLSFLAGCGKTEKGEAVKKAEAPAAPKVFVDDGKPLNFRGITMGVSLKEQFKDCKSADKPAGGCFKEGVKGEAFKQYQMEGLPKLDFLSTEYVALVDDKVELILVEFNKEYAGKNVMALVKGQFGEPASYKSDMMTEKAGDIPYERFLATWNVKSCVLELSNVRDSLVDSGRLLIRSDRYLKKEGQSTKK